MGDAGSSDYRLDGLYRERKGAEHHFGPYDVGRYETVELPKTPAPTGEPHREQAGTYYCSGCGRKFRYTHDGEAVCLTLGCPFGKKKP